MNTWELSTDPTLVDAWCYRSAVGPFGPVSLYCDLSKLDLKPLSESQAVQVSKQIGPGDTRGMLLRRSATETQQRHINKDTSTKTHQQRHINKDTSTKTHQQRHINRDTSTETHQQRHINKDTSTRTHLLFLWHCCLSPHRLPFLGHHCLSLKLRFVFPGHHCPFL